MTRMSFFLIIIALGSCKLYEPSLPQWDTSWKIELQQDAVKISDIIKSESLKDSLDPVNGESVFFINISDTSEKQQIAATDLSIKTSDQFFSNNMGVFEVKKPENYEIQGSTFADLFENLNPQPGIPLPPIASVTLEPNPTDVTFDEFKKLDIAAAQIKVIFYNNLVLEIGDNMRILMFDKQRMHENDGGIIDTIIFADKIPSNTFRESNTIDLSGKTISNELVLKYLIPISGTDSMMTLTQDDIDSYFYSELVMSEIKVNSALAKVPEQNIIRENTAPVDADDHTIQTAKVAKGKLHLLVNNNMNIDTEFKIELPNFVDSDNKQLVINDFIAATSHKAIPVNLAGYLFQNENSDNSNIEQIYYKMTAVTQATEDYVWVSADDSVSVTAVFDTLFFDYLQGDIARTEIEFDPVHKKDLLDFDDLNGNFRLPELMLTINFHNKINYAINVLMQVKGYSYDDASNAVNDSVVIFMDHFIKPGESDNSENRIILDKKSSDPSIVDLMSIMPDEIIVSGTAIIEGAGSVHSGDQVWMDYIIDSPLALKIDEPLEINSEAQQLSEKDLDAEKRNKIAENLTEVRIQLSTENGLPVGSEFSFYMSADSSDLFSENIEDSTQKFIIKNQIVAAKTDLYGYVSETIRDEHLIELTKAQIALFEQFPLYYGFKVSLDPTDKAVTFRTRDRLLYQPVLSFDVLMDPDNF